MFNSSVLRACWAAFLAVQRLKKVLLVNGSTRRRQLAVELSEFKRDLATPRVLRKISYASKLYSSSPSTQSRLWSPAKKLLHSFCLSVNRDQFSLYTYTKIAVKRWILPFCSQIKSISYLFPVYYNKMQLNMAEFSEANGIHYY